VPPLTVKACAARRSVRRATARVRPSSLKCPARRRSARVSRGMGAEPLILDPHAIRLLGERVSHHDLYATRRSGRLPSRSPAPVVPALQVQFSPLRCPCRWHSSNASRSGAIAWRSGSRSSPRGLPRLAHQNVEQTWSTRLVPQPPRVAARLLCPLSIAYQAERPTSFRVTEGPCCSDACRCGYGILSANVKSPVRGRKQFLTGKVILEFSSSPRCGAVQDVVQGLEVEPSRPVSKYQSVAGRRGECESRSEYCLMLMPQTASTTRCTDTARLLAQPDNRSGLPPAVRLEPGRGRSPGLRRRRCFTA